MQNRVTGNSQCEFITGRSCCVGIHFGENLAALEKQGTVVDNVFLNLNKTFGTSPTVLSKLGVCGGMVVSGG